MDSPCQPRKRHLYDWEIAEIQPIFAGSFEYDRVWIHECATWTDAMDRLGRRLKRMDPPGPRDHNAITLGNHCFFPVGMPEHLPPVGDDARFKIDWMVHELTHAWQYQHMGWIYLAKALWAQFREKAKAYDFGDEAGLKSMRKESKTFASFNPEQQGNITQSYYIRIHSSPKQDVSAWLPYIEDIQRTVRKPV